MLDPPQALCSAAPVDAWEHADAGGAFAQECRQWGPLALSGPWGSGTGVLVLVRQGDGALEHTVEREFVRGVGLVRERITTASSGRLVTRQEMVLQSVASR